MPKGHVEGGRWVRPASLTKEKLTDDRVVKDLHVGDARAFRWGREIYDG